MINEAYIKTILVTGGCGFIGSHLLRLLVIKYPKYLIINIDALTYSGNVANTEDFRNNKNYLFIQGNINDSVFVQKTIEEYKPQVVIHLAAETHVDRSISNPDDFLHTNIIGTHNLLQASVSLLNTKHDIVFYHISTDEVFGSLGVEGAFNESSPYTPQSPYATSKAASDMLVKSYGNTYRLPFIISNCSNNYGTHQYPEKLIPLCIINILQGKNIPVYGDGKNVRDWISVADHVHAIDTILHSGHINEQYCVGGDNEWSNIDLVKQIVAITDELLGNEKGHSLPLITYVSDRKGHDYRYAIDNTKVSTHTHWKPNVIFELELKRIVQWYIDNESWWRPILDTSYEKYYQSQYKNI